jgi:hypothetical protein
MNCSADILFCSHCARQLSYWAYRTQIPECNWFVLCFWVFLYEDVLLRHTQNEEMSLPDQFKLLCAWIVWQYIKKWEKKVHFLKCGDEVIPGSVRQTLSAQGRLMIWHHSKWTFSKNFSLGQGYRIHFRARTQTEDNFLINSFVCAYPNLLAPYFRLFQWCFSAKNRLVFGAVVRLA